MQTIIDEIFKTVKVGIKIGSNNIQITNARNEMMLPSKASLWEDQILVDLNDIRSIRTKEDFDYYIILDMYDGRQISLKYSFSSNMKRDLNLIIERRQSHRRPRTSGTEFYFEF